MATTRGSAWAHRCSDVGLVATEAYRLYPLYRGGVVTVTHFATLTEGRAHFTDLFDAAESGRPASVRRDSSRAAVVDAERLRLALAALRPSGAELVAEAGGWSMFIPGLPVAADAATVDEVLGEMVEALRDYAQDWTDRLLHAPNHAQNWGLVQLIALSDDQQLKDWLVGE